MGGKKVSKLCLEACAADVLVYFSQATGVFASRAGMPSNASHWQLIAQISGNKTSPAKWEKMSKNLEKWWEPVGQTESDWKGRNCVKKRI